jgi:thioesterase domain-containing protein
MDPARLTRGRPAPLFLVGGLEGPPHPGLPLAGALGPEVPCRGLDLPGRGGERRPLDDVLAMAVHQLPGVLAAQPFGPYQLAGYGSGGLVAYELARLLRGLGQPVRPVILLDSVLPLAGHPPLSADSVLAVRELARMRHLACGWQGACRCGVDHGAPLAAQGARIARALGAGDPNRYEEHILAAIDVYSAALRAFAAYQPGPSDLRVVLIRSADWSNVWGLPSQIARHTSPCLGWERVPVAGLRLHVVATDRPGLFTGTALHDVAGIVAHYLTGRPAGPDRPATPLPEASAVLRWPPTVTAAPAPGRAALPATVGRRGPAAWPDDLQVSVS